MTKITIPTNPDILAYLSMKLAETEALEMQHGEVIDRLRAEVAAADARAEAAVRAVLRHAAWRCELEDYMRLDPVTEFDKGYHQGHEQACDENAATLRALAADIEQVARIAKGRP